MKPGFTLIEMTMVLLIVGLLVGSFIIPLGAQMDINNLKLTDQRLAQAKEALLGYAARNRRLPCPASNAINGTQDTTICAQEGFLPWADLGVESRDAWGNYLHYRADSAHTTITGAYNISIPAATDALEVKNKAETLSLVKNAVAIIFSSGKNKTANALNATTVICALPTIICPLYFTDPIYTQDDFIPNDFDDRLIWLSDSELVSRLTAAGFRIK